MSRLHYQKGKKAEIFVQHLATKTFLRDWAFRNPEKADGKEICDFFVVFDEIAVVWQIKTLKLGKDKHYREREVEKNLQQLSGAWKYLLNIDNKIILKSPRRGEILFRPQDIKQKYSISVLVGESQEIFPFMQIYKDFHVHVFNKEFASIILNELDTVSDFTKYLKNKEIIFNTKNIVAVNGGEEELLAIYLLGQKSFRQLKEYNAVTIEQGYWEQIKKRPEYQAKEKANEISYQIWDRIIDQIQTSEHPDYERIARELTRLNRFQRRSLAEEFFEAHLKATRNENSNNFRRYLASKGTTYCFVFADDSIPREERRLLLAKVCKVARGRFKHNKKVIGIATGKDIRKPTCSFDFCYLKKEEWTKQDQRNMEIISKDIGATTTINPRHVLKKEYPSIKTKSI